MVTQKKEQKKKELYFIRCLTGDRIIEAADMLNFSHNLKIIFFNFKTSKWLPSEYKIFVKTHNLNYSQCYKVLSTLEFNVYSIKPKGFHSFLKSIEKYNIKQEDNRKIALSKEKRIAFLIDLERVRVKHLKVTKKKYIDFIFENFDTGFTKLTLTKKYYEKEFD